MNVLRGEDPRKRVGPSTLRSGNRRAKIPQQETKVWQDEKKTTDPAGEGKEQDDKTMGDLGRETRASIQQDNKITVDSKQETGASVGSGIWTGTRAGIEEGNKEGRDLGWKDKEDPTRT